MAWLSGWAKRRKITIDNTNIDSDLTHFPVPVPLGTAVGQSDDDVSSIFDEVGSSSLKIAVTKGDGTTQIYAEIEHWDDVNEKALLWVSKSDLTLTAASVTELYIYYDSSQSDNTAYIGTPGNRTEVWDIDFAAVYTMAQDPSGGADCIIDSSGNGNHGTPSGSMTSGDLINGEIGRAINFDGSDDKISIPQFSFKNNKTVQFIANPSAEQVEVFMDRYGSMNLKHGDSFQAQNAYGSSLYWTSDTNFLNVRRCYTVTTTSSDLEFFLDSSSQGVKSYSNNIFNIDIISEYFQGKIESIRFFNAIMSADWIKADYHAQTDNLLTWGVEETAGDPSVIVGHFTTTNTLTGSVEFNQVAAGHFQTTNALTGGGIVGESVTVGHFQTTNTLTGSVEHNQITAGHFQTTGTLTGTGVLSLDTFVTAGHFQATNTLTGSVEFNQITAGHFQTDSALNFASYLLSVPGAHFQADNTLAGTYELIKYENFISLFRFILTGGADGVADAEIPITSFQICMYADKNSYLAVSIPSVDYADDITARSNGTLKLMIVYAKIDTLSDIRSETLLETAFDDLRTDDGSKNRSITLEGHETDAQAAARQTNPKTITLDPGWINYRRTGTGGWTARLVKPHLDLRAGDTVIDDGVSYSADRITWMKSESVHHMEITGATT